MKGLLLALVLAAPAHAGKFYNLETYPSSGSMHIGYDTPGSIRPGLNSDRVFTSSGAAVVQSTSATAGHKPLRVKSLSGSELLSVDVAGNVVATQFVGGGAGLTGVPSSATVQSLLDFRGSTIAAADYGLRGSTLAATDWGLRGSTLAAVDYGLRGSTLAAVDWGLRTSTLAAADWGLRGSTLAAVDYGLRGSTLAAVDWGLRTSTLAAADWGLRRSTLAAADYGLRGSTIAFATFAGNAGQIWASTCTILAPNTTISNSAIGVALSTVSASVTAGDVLLTLIAEGYNNTALYNCYSYILWDGVMKAFIRITSTAAGDVHNLSIPPYTIGNASGGTHYASFGFGTQAGKQCFINPASVGNTQFCMRYRTR